MLRSSFRRIASLPEFVPFDGMRLTRMPKWLEFYSPVIEGTQHLVEAIQHTTQCPWWLSIGLLTLAIRSTMTPFLILQMRSVRPLAKVSATVGHARHETAWHTIQGLRALPFSEALAQRRAFKKPSKVSAKQVLQRKSVQSVNVHSPPSPSLLDLHVVSQAPRCDKSIYGDWRDAVVHQPCRSRPDNDIAFGEHGVNLLHTSGWVYVARNHA